MNNNAFTTQLQIRKNAEEQNDFLKELCDWENEMTALEQTIKPEASIEQDESSQLFSSIEGNIDCRESISAKQTIPTTSIKMAAPAPEMYRNSAESGKKIIKSSLSLSEEERQRGDKLFSSSKFEEAIQAYSKSLQLNPQSSLAYSNRGKNKT